MLLFTQNKVKEEKKKRFNIQYSGKQELEALRAELGCFHTGAFAAARSVELVSHLIHT